MSEQHSGTRLVARATAKLADGRYRTDIRAGRTPVTLALKAGNTINTKVA